MSAGAYQPPQIDAPTTADEMAERAGADLPPKIDAPLWAFCEELGPVLWPDMNEPGHKVYATPQATLREARRLRAAMDDTEKALYEVRIDRDAFSDDVDMLMAEIAELQEDKERLDWLEAVLGMFNDPVEVFLAGLRTNANLMQPDAYQVEMESASKQFRRVYQGDSLRAAIDEAIQRAAGAAGETR